MGNRIVITIELPDGASVSTGASTPAATRHDAPQDSSQADPWGSPSDSPGSAAASRTEPSRAVSPEPSNVRVVDTKNGQQTWTFHAPNAPLCECDQPAAHVQGTKKDGKPWKSWRCAKGSGKDWRDKCDFNEWA